VKGLLLGRLVGSFGRPVRRAVISLIFAIRFLGSTRANESLTLFTVIIRTINHSFRAYQIRRRVRWRLYSLWSS
jgi:hypothetical protein